MYTRNAGFWLALASGDFPFFFLLLLLFLVLLLLLLVVVVGAGGASCLGGDAAPSPTTPLQL